VKGKVQEAGRAAKKKRATAVNAAATFNEKVRGKAKVLSRARLMHKLIN
jgi:hypothetical protein